MYFWLWILVSGSFFNLLQPKSFAGGVKDKLLQSIVADEDVLFSWSILATEWDTEEE